jgi:hypothetical protein
MTTTWSTTDKSAACTLSGGNLVASFPSASLGVRSIDRVYSGKYYWEVTFTTASNLSIGICPGGANLATLASGTATAQSVIVTSGGTSFMGATSLGSIGGTFGNGWVLCVALDATNGIVWFRNGAAGNWDGNAAHNPATGAGGNNFVPIGAPPGFGVYACANGGGGGGVATANFGASGFTGAVPSGFTSGFPDSTTPVTNAVDTQVTLEHWLTTNPDAQVTQVALEHWATVTGTGVQAIATQIALEHWASVANVPTSINGPMITMIG